MVFFGKLALFGGTNVSTFWKIVVIWELRTVFFGKSALFGAPMLACFGKLAFLGALMQARFQKLTFLGSLLRTVLFG